LGDSLWFDQFDESGTTANDRDRSADETGCRKGMRLFFLVNNERTQIKW
jgi:hypothetical protein